MLVCALCTDQVLLCGYFFGVSVSNGFLDFLYSFLTMLLAILFHHLFLLLFNSPRPNLNIVHLLCLVQLKLLALFLQKIRVEGHDRLIVEVFLRIFQRFNPVSANLSNTFNGELSEYLFGAFLLFDLQTQQCIIDRFHVHVLLLTLDERNLLSFSLLGLLCHLLLKGRLDVLVDLLLLANDLLPLIVLIFLLLFDLGLDFSEDSASFIYGCALVLHLLEHRAKLVTKVDQVFMHLSDLIK